MKPVEPIDLEARVAHLESLVTLLIAHSVADTWIKLKNGQRLSGYAQDLNACAGLARAAMGSGARVEREQRDTAAMWLTAIAETDDNPQAAVALEGLPRRMIKAVAQSTSIHARASL